MQRYTGDVIATSLEETIEGMKKRMQEDYVEQGFGRWAVIYKPDNKFVGWSGLKYLPEFDTVDIGYRFFPDYWGMGIGTEAALPIIKYGFEDLGLKLITGVAMKENQASINILKKIGMTFDKMAPYEEGSVDVAWYSIAKKDYKEWD